MSATQTLSREEIAALAGKALRAAGASASQAGPLAAAVAAAEADGIASHGLAYVATYCEHLRCGKVLGDVVPEVTRPKPALLLVDARSGFAHPAIDAGFAELVPLARELGVAAMAVRNSYNCGVLGYHTERLAAAGLIGLGFTNAPASIAPLGGRKAVIGTNPFAVAVPDGNGGSAISIDQSASVVAKSEVMRHKRAGKAIPEGWAFAPDGSPTTDADVALKGTMAPSGGHKGVGAGLMVEILAAAASGAVLGIDASPFSGPTGGPPRTGQFFIAIDAAASSGGAFGERIARLTAAIAEQQGAHVPGARRQAARARAGDGIKIASDLVAQIAAMG
ncbi:MAG TPA: Ldh family oxidoreductase [Xanthobacteraceae bacterium]